MTRYRRSRSSFSPGVGRPPPPVISPAPSRGAPNGAGGASRARKVSAPRSRSISTACRICCSCWRGCWRGTSAAPKCCGVTSAAWGPSGPAAQCEGLPPPHAALDVVLGLPEGQPRLRQLIDVRRCLNMQLRVQAQVSQHRLRRHGPLQRLAGVSLPGVAQGKDSEAEIEYNTEPEPHRVFRTLHAADAPANVPVRIPEMPMPIISRPTATTKDLFGP